MMSLRSMVCRIRLVVACVCGVWLVAQCPVAVAQRTNTAAVPPPIVAFTEKPDTGSSAHSSVGAHSSAGLSAVRTLSVGQVAALKTIRSNPLASAIRVGRSVPAAIIAVRDTRMLSIDVPSASGASPRQITFTGVDVRHNNGIISLYAEDDATDSQVLLVIRGPDVLGSFSHGRDTYKVNPLGDGVTVVYRVDESQFPPMDPPGFNGMQAVPSVDFARDDTQESQGSAAERDKVINVMFVYTAEGAKYALERNSLELYDSLVLNSSLELTNQLLISTANKVFENSKQSVYLKSAGTMISDYEESNSIETDLIRLRGGHDGYLDSIHVGRAVKGADLVTLVRRSSGSDGIGVAAWPSRYRDWIWEKFRWKYYYEHNPSFGFNVMSLGAQSHTYDVFTHEIGHNIGADHNPASSTTRRRTNTHRPIPHRHGRCNTEENWRTIMSYNDGCATSIPYFSSPDLFYKGTRIGNHATYNVRWLIEEHAWRVIQYLPPPIYGEDHGEVRADATRIGSVPVELKGSIFEGDVDYFSIDTNQPQNRKSLLFVVSPEGHGGLPEDSDMRVSGVVEDYSGKVVMEVDQPVNEDFFLETPFLEPDFYYFRLHATYTTRREAPYRLSIESRIESRDEYRVTVPSGRQRFVRIINRSGAPGKVRIHAIDDAGERFGPVTLSLDAWQAQQFNSRDLERGNPSKGLSGAVGDGRGHWRLVLTTELKIEALAYNRNSDGFLTSMNQVVPGRGYVTTAITTGPWWRLEFNVPFFNPGSSYQRRSWLRLVNPLQSEARIEITATDDTGAPGKSTVELTLPAGAERKLSAQELEAGGLGFEGSFGDGTGRWRLTVYADGPLAVMNLLESSTGILTNLSSPPPVWRVSQPRGSDSSFLLLPLVRPASHPGQQGFVRIINHSYAPGEVRIHAIDDAGERFGPVTLSLGARQTRHFNSADLEEGNPGKGLSGGVGDGRGNWRLELRTELEIDALAYIRTSDGFVTSMHEVVEEEVEEVEVVEEEVVEWSPEPTGFYHSYWVPFFSPASSVLKRSWLRLVNLGESDADIVLSAWDDRGALSESQVHLMLPAGEARALSVRALEAGGSDFAGRFGDGTGRWRLSVSANRPLAVMNLLESPTTGNLANLSSPGRVTW